MTSSFPSAWSLIVDSWHTFVKHWSTTVRVAAWFIVAAAIQQIHLLFPEDSGKIAALIIAGIIGGLVSLWVGIRLYQVIFALEDGESVTAKTTATAMMLVIPFFLASLLQGIATAGAFILLIIPGIYVGVRLAFTPTFFVEEGTRLQGASGASNTAAFPAIGSSIMHSWEKTKGKFWAIFGRQALAGFLFVLGMMLVGGVVVLAIMLLVGGSERLDTIANTPVGSYLLNLINGVVQVAFAALAVHFQVKLYRAVKKA